MLDTIDITDQLDLAFVPCGLNADWNCSAWHVDLRPEPNAPNTVSGDVYILENESEGSDEPLKFMVVRCHHDQDGTSRVVDVDNRHDLYAVEAVVIAIKAAYNLT